MTQSMSRVAHCIDNGPMEGFWGILKRERYYGSFSRSFDISGINADAIEASYTDGVLTLTMPKKQEQLPASRRLEIK